MKPKITQAVKSSVNAYLMARTHAEVHRARVDKIQRFLLNDTPYYANPDLVSRREMPERITDPKNTFLMTDDESADYLTDLKHELIKAGYNIKSIKSEPEHSYQCPALVAESLQNTTERLLIDSAAEMLGETDDFHLRLLCAGLGKRQQFIDLVVKLVVSMPDFKNPLTGKP